MPIKLYKYLITRRKLYFVLCGFTIKKGLPPCLKIVLCLLADVTVLRASCGRRYRLFADHCDFLRVKYLTAKTFFRVSNSNCKNSKKVKLLACGCKNEDVLARVLFYDCTVRYKFTGYVVRRDKERIVLNN